MAEDWLMDDTETLGDVAIEAIMTALVEPLDWWSMAEDCYNGECSPWMLLGLLPIIPGSIGSKVDNLAAAAGNKVDGVVAAVNKMDGATKSVDETLDLAIDFLREGYVDMGNGRFVSADGLRQVRMGVADILSKRPHMNFELLMLDLKRPGRTMVLQNIHIYLLEMLK